MFYKLLSAFYSSWFKCICSYPLFRLHSSAVRLFPLFNFLFPSLSLFTPEVRDWGLIKSGLFQEHVSTPPSAPAPLYPSGVQLQNASAYSQPPSTQSSSSWDSQAVSLVAAPAVAPAASAPAGDAGGAEWWDEKFEFNSESVIRRSSSELWKSLI